MNELNDIMLEMYVNDYIDLDTYLESTDDTVFESANKDAAVKYRKLKTEYRDVIKRAKNNIKNHNYDEAAKELSKTLKYCDEVISDLKKIKNSDDEMVKSLITGIIRNWLTDLFTVFCGSLLSPLSLGLSYLYTQVMVIIKTVQDIKDAIDSYNEGENINLYISRLIRCVTKFKVTINKTITVIKNAEKHENDEKKHENEEDNEGVAESVSDYESAILDMYLEGTIDNETFNTLMLESDDEDDEDDSSSECFDDAIDILKKLKKNPNDQKLMEKLNEKLNNCGVTNNDDESDDNETQESVISFESSDPAVEDIMESVTSIDHDLKYVSEVLNSNLVMTESSDVLSTVFNEISKRMTSVKAELGKLKGSLVKVKDSKISQKLVRIIKDCTARFDKLVVTMKNRISSAVANNKNSDNSETFDV